MNDRRDRRAGGAGATPDATRPFVVVSFMNYPG